MSLLQDIEKYENRHFFACTDIKSHIALGIYLIHGKCESCPGRVKGCPHCNGKGYLASDYLPDVWYDMPCAQGDVPSSPKTLFIIRPKDSRKAILTDCAGYDAAVASYIFGWMKLTQKQKRFIKSIDRIAASSMSERFCLLERREFENQYYSACSFILSESSSLDKMDVSEAEERILSDIRSMFENEGIDFDTLRKGVRYPSGAVLPEIKNL